ncbi:hypothetical protein GCM10027443_20310 [Pontibacter brevis]
MGRDLEWAEYVALYTKVHFESLMDLPVTQQKETVLEAVLQVADEHENYFSTHAQLKAEEVLSFITMDKANPDSILAYVNRIRELARGARDTYSPELWEHINGFYHAMNSYSAEDISREGVHSFTGKIASNSFQIKGYLLDSMLRNEAWVLFSLGIYLERTLLVARTLLHQVCATTKQEDAGQDDPENNFQYVLLLESMGAYGMFKQVYQKNATRALALDFLVLNTTFPKSIAFNLSSIHAKLNNLFDLQHEEKQQLEATLQKIQTQCEAFTPGDEAGKIADFLEKTADNLKEFAQQLEQTYLKF